MRKTATFVLLALMLAAMANAALIVNKVTDEFSVLSPYPADNVKSCQCGTMTEILEVTNVGDFETLFEVQIESPISEHITVGQSTFTLQPGQSEQVRIYIWAPCEQSLDTYYIAHVSTNYGRSKEVFKRFVSQVCQSIKYDIENPENKLLPAETAKISVNIENVGGYDQTFSITPLDYANYVRINEKEITLRPSETDTFVMRVTLPVEMSGEFKVPFIISTDKSQEQAQGYAKFYIEPDYDFAFATEELDINACEDVTKKEVVTFKNLGSVPNKYALSLRGPAFAKLGQESLSLAAKDSDSITIDIAPRQIEVGEYELTLSATSEYGKISKSKTYKLKVNDCFASSASLEGWQEITDKDCCGPKTYNLNLVNQGLYEETYEISTDSPGWIDVPEEYRFVRLRPTQQANIPILANLPCADAKQNNYVIVKQLRAPHVTHEFKVYLESLSTETCHVVDLIEQSYTLNPDSSTLDLFVQNNGLRTGTYQLSIADDKMVSLAEQSITLEPGEMKTITLNVNTSGYQFGTYLNQLSLNLRLDQGPSYERQFWIVLVDKSFVAKAMAFIKGINYAAITLCAYMTILAILIAVALLSCLLYLKIKVDKLKRTKIAFIKKLKIFNAVLIGLLIVCILSLVLLGSPDQSRFYQEPSGFAGPLFHEWRENTQYTIDIAQYFSDPDGDTLTYSASQPNHIQVKITAGEATLTPEFGWSGREFIVFSATDSTGETTKGEIMTLNVIAKKPVGFIDYWNAYCIQIMLAVAMVILILALMITDVYEEKAYLYYRPKRK